MSNELIDIDADSVSFDLQSWMGKPPDALVAARSELLSLPTGLKFPLFPIPTHLPAAEFIALQLPYASRSSDIVSGSVASWFSRDAPCTSISTLGQFWLDGYQSIVDPRCNDGQDRFPLWTLKLWLELGLISDTQASWRSAFTYLRRQAVPDAPEVTRKAAEEMLGLLGKIGWEEPIGTTGLQTTSLIRFFGKAWLSEEQIALQVHHMRERLKMERPKSGLRVLFAPLLFTNKLLQTSIQHSYDDEHVRDTVMRRIEEQVYREDIDVLYAPAHVQNNHWIVVAANFKDGTVSFGDSLFDSRYGVYPRKIIQKLQLWSKKRFMVPLNDMGNVLPIGQQTDSLNCGVCWADAVMTAVWGDPGWKPQLGVMRRIRWGIRMAKECASVCSEPTTVSPTAGAERMTASSTSTPVTLPSLRRHHLNELLNPDVEAAHTLPPEQVAIEPDTDSEDEEASNAASRTGGDDSDTSLHSSTSERSTLSATAAKIGKALKHGLQQVSTTTQTTLTAGMKYTMAATSRTTKKIIGKRKRKRKRKPDDSESDVEPPKARPAGTGTARSSVHTRNARQAFREGTFRLDMLRYKGWLEGMAEIDDKFAYRPGNGKQPYDLTRARQHSASCGIKKRKYKKHTQNTHRMDEYLSAGKASRKEAEFRTLSRVPCPGIGPDDDIRVTTYLERTAVSGGGGQSVTALSKQFFKRFFSRLDSKQRRQVLDAQEQSHTWENKHHSLPVRVYSRTCKKLVCDLSPLRTAPCRECQQVLRSRSFKTAIHRPKPEDRHYVHTPYRFRSPLMGQIYARAIGVKELIERKSRDSPFIRYTLGALRGEYNDEVFKGLTEAMVTQHDKESRGVGLQNFPLRRHMTTSLKFLTYKVRQHTVHFPSICQHSRNAIFGILSLKEGKQPKFPMTICEQTYELALKHLEALAWTGPVGLSVDDTKLCAAHRLYWDSEKGAYMLVGSSSGPFRVDNPDAVRKLIEQAQLDKATKLRLFTLSVQAPGSTPILLHAMPIGSKNWPAEKLEPYSLTLLTGLIERGIRVVSYACDGTESERAIQRLLVEHADQRIEYEIPGDDDSANFKIDSKHALKTFRNNLFSGARILTLGNHIAHFAQIYQVAFEEGSPLYHRDVEKLDRQDDGAATRMFSADTLQYIAENHPDWPFAIIYLFVFGELVDAYQNRSLSHHIRFQMVMRAKYFLDAWSDFIDCAEYDKARHHLSRECLDISRIIIEGYLLLLIIYRDDFPDTPLLPWLHSSEACEHTFGICRQLVKDFTYLDFLYMVPRLQFPLDMPFYDLEHPMGKHEQEGLSSFPTTDEMKPLATAARADANALCTACGVDAVIVRRMQDRFRRERIPSIADWLHRSGDDVESINSENDDNASISASIGDGNELNELLSQLDTESFRSSTTAAGRAKATTLSMAAATLLVDQYAMVQQYSQPTVDDHQHEDEEAQEIAHYLSRLSSTDTTPISGMAAVSLIPSLFGTAGTRLTQPTQFDYSALVSLRREHQTHQAAQGVRVHVHVEPASESAKRQLIKSMRAILKQTEDRGLTTGIDRALRTQSLGGEPATVTSAGNAANAAASAATRAREAFRKRRKLFADANVARLTDIESARISAVRPLLPHDWVLVAADVVTRNTFDVYLAQGCPHLVCGAGKYGKHGLVVDGGKSNIAALSFVGVQLYELSLSNGTFQSVTKQTVHLDTSTFAHLPSLQILALVKAPQKSHTSSQVALSDADFTLFSAERVPANISKALIQARKRKVAEEVDE
ncbi:hypothetical protein MIND_01289500 [Mycena indigotica]|uniref:Ubiquitin-like protease family profile domain-containing protein n=1 Tax=Mycena indigotica TaxID=2126181 RepID=A0A8H6VX58_9AGAR|nr:uncharacterized protein MIND_01289500 [Mycena indigotica]KAF7291444.1 hypothetical protein MIND_01289500 [Mycena indigotica]